ncbi:hypothetical protein MJO28_017294 [Puccinia striiformis f. sp. tritici]|nr:hypothetical protein MJO28_017294 [Puccinia striiformis f. sp. tritici]
MRKLSRCFFSVFPSSDDILSSLICLLGLFFLYDSPTTTHFSGGADSSAGRVENLSGCQRPTLKDNTGGRLRTPSVVTVGI